MKERILSSFADFQEKYRFFSIIFLRLPVLWFPLVLTYFGDNLKLVSLLESGKRHLTVLGIIVTCVIVIVSLVAEYSLLNNKGRENDYNYYKYSYYVLRGLKDSINNVCNTKKNTLLTKIQQIKMFDVVEAPLIVSNPQRQLDNLVKEMQSCLLDFLHVSGGKRWTTNDLYVSIAYEFPEDNTGWKWATEERGMDLPELFSTDDPDGNISTLLYLLNGRSSSVFFNEKEKARQRGVYLPDALDEFDDDDKLLGSIACYENKIKKGDVTYIHFVLSISSYKKKFYENDMNVEQNDGLKNTRDHMENMVVFEFLERIGIELSLLYLESLYNRNRTQEDNTPR